MVMWSKSDVTPGDWTPGDRLCVKTPGDRYFYFRDDVTPSGQVVKWSTSDVPSGQLSSGQSLM